MQQRVEIHDGWFGIVIAAGPCQSEVKITECDEPLLMGKIIVFMNHDLTLIPLSEEEKSEMATVMELTTQYNELAQANGLPPIKKFKDKATAEKRIAAIGGKAIAALEKKTPEIKKEDGISRKDEIVNDFKFKKAKGGNQREDLLNKLLEHANEMVSKSSLGKLAVAISGLLWAIDNKKLGKKYEIKEEKKDGQIWYGFFIHHQ